jgi:GT2 family glycosyltransferase
MPYKASVIIPTYNRPSLLKRCLEALIQQDFQKEDFEVVVITDGPDSITASMITEFKNTTPDFNCVCYSLPVKKGPAAARNAGWKAAGAELILFTDDDCIPSIGWVNSFYQASQFYGQRPMAFTGKVTVPLSKSPTDFELNTAHLETASFVTANCAVSRSVLELVNGFDEAFAMAWREDSDLEFKLKKHGIAIAKIEEAEVIHPARKAAWGVSIREQKKAMYDALLFRKHPELYKANIYSPVVWKYFFMVTLFITFLVAILCGNGWLALATFSIWICLAVLFIKKRLSRSSRSFSHIAEMVATSLLIPFCSLYWNLYGAIKFKALHISKPD